MYARFIDEFTVIPAPDTYWGIRDFNKKPEIMKQHGFLPVISESLKQHMRPRYEVVNGEIQKTYVEYSGDALTAYREKMISRLQGAFKQYEQRFLNSSDITMASTLAVMRKPKGMAVTIWLSLFWQAYFTEKTKIETASCSADFAQVVIQPDLQGEPPHTMRELSEESAELYAEISAESEKV